MGRGKLASFSQKRKLIDAMSTYTDETTLISNEQMQRLGELQLASMVGFVMSVTIGFVLLLFSGLYVQDLEALKSAPETLWNFICGVPVEEDFVLPLLLTFCLLAFCAAGALLILRWWLWQLQQGQASSEESA